MGALTHPSGMAPKRPNQPTTEESAERNPHRDRADALDKINQALTELPSRDDVDEVLVSVLDRWVPDEG